MQCKRQTLQHYLERGNNPDRNSQSLVNIGLSDLLSNADGNGNGDGDIINLVYTDDVNSDAGASDTAVRVSEEDDEDEEMLSSPPTLPFASSPCLLNVNHPPPSV